MLNEAVSPGRTVSVVGLAWIPKLVPLTVTKTIVVSVKPPLVPVTKTLYSPGRVDSVEFTIRVVELVPPLAKPTWAELNEIVGLGVKG